MTGPELIKLLVDAIENNVESWDMVGDLKEALDKGHIYLIEEGLEK